MKSERSVQLLTLVGVPGIGKSRLVAELFQIISDSPELVTWRQGRSLPYGEGVTYWALGEMIKNQAGILETDDGAQAGQKLHDEVARLFGDNREAGSVETKLRSLVGIETAAAQTDDTRQENFYAWRRFFEELADRRPAVLVFEDLHWADADLLDFIDHLVDWAEDIPLLCVCTARPELFDRRPGWGGGKPNASTISLSPLSDEETAKLLMALLERTVLPAEQQAALLRRAGGNPLYAEQFARMLVERGDADELPIPETVQGIIAARLDGLDPEEKALLQDAAVVGKVFWSGPLTQMNGRNRSGVEHMLHALTRKEFVRGQRRSSVEGESEYAFLHLLVPDVAYSQIPRAARLAKHRAVAEWMASLGRAEDHAEVVAHHYLQAHRLWPGHRRGRSGARGEREARASQRRRPRARPERVLFCGTLLSTRPRSLAARRPGAGTRALRPRRSTLLGRSGDHRARGGPRRAHETRELGEGSRGRSNGRVRRLTRRELAAPVCSRRSSLSGNARPRARRRSFSPNSPFVRRRSSTRAGSSTRKKRSRWLRVSERKTFGHPS